jgi:hypothetical protein
MNRCLVMGLFTQSKRVSRISMYLDDIKIYIVKYVVLKDW